MVAFTLNWTSTHLCVIDFADNLIDRVIRKGYREARCLPFNGQALNPIRPNFVKDPGEPVFSEV